MVMKFNLVYFFRLRVGYLRRVALFYHFGDLTDCNMPTYFSGATYVLVITSVSIVKAEWYIV